MEKLELDPDFEDYAREAFKPLGVYLNFWRPEIKPGELRIDVSLINDERGTVDGDVVLTFETAAGREVLRASKPMRVASMGQQTLSFPVAVPDAPGDVMVRATARASNGKQTVRRRKTAIVR